jgi:gluconolactonase
MKRCSLAMALLCLCGVGVGAQDSATRAFELRAKSPQFWRLVSRHAKLARMGGGFGFTEGPVWDPGGLVYVNDEVQNKIFRLYPDGRPEKLIELGDPDGNTFDAQMQLIDCASVLRGMIRVSKEGHFTVLADRYQGKRFNSPNDVVVGPGGGSGALVAGQVRGETIHSKESRQT